MKKGRCAGGTRHDLDNRGYDHHDRGAGDFLGSSRIAA